MRFAKKSLGQNFLKDKNIIKKILNLTEFTKRNIIEIGPGTGSLTEELLKQKLKSLILIEKDAKLFESLEKKYKKNKKIKIYCADILQFDLEKIVPKNSIIIGNLPYNISSQILVKILRFRKWPPNFKDVIFMFQKELGEKIIGKFLTPFYGRISILSNFRLDILNRFIVSPNCFTPKPKVESMVIHFKPKKNINFKIKKIYNLEKITNIFFSNKRKMINKILKKILNKKKIGEIPKLNSNLRPEEVSPEFFYKIAELYEKM